MGLFCVRQNNDFELGRQSYDLLSHWTGAGARRQGRTPPRGTSTCSYPKSDPATPRPRALTSPLHGIDNPAYASRVGTVIIDGHLPRQYSWSRWPQWSIRAVPSATRAQRLGGHLRDRQWRAVGSCRALLTGRSRLQRIAPKPAALTHQDPAWPNGKLDASLFERPIRFAPMSASSDN